MSARIDFEQARQSQLSWMQEVKNFIEGFEDLREEDLSSHLNSKLGKWYYESGREKYGDLEPVKKFEIKQIKLHKIAKEIFEARKENQYALAQELYDDLVANSKLMIALLNEAESQIIKETYVTAIHDESLIQNYDKPVAWDKTKILMSKTNADGVIEYVNEVFLAVGGYDGSELLDKPHNIVRHPDMPKVIYKMLWEDLKEKKTVTIILKNKAKSGKYFWLASDFKVTVDANDKIESIAATHRGIDVEVINTIIDPLYKRLLDIEHKSGEKSCENYLKGYLEERNRTLSDFTQNVLKTGKNITNEKQKGFLGGFFNRD